MKEREIERKLKGKGDIVIHSCGEPSWHISNAFVLGLTHKNKYTK